jgi:hypothetical protein
MGGSQRPESHRSPHSCAVAVAHSRSRKSIRLSMVPFTESRAFSSFCNCAPSPPPPPPPSVRGSRAHRSARVAGRAPRVTWRGGVNTANRSRSSPPLSLPLCVCLGSAFEVAAFQTKSSDSSAGGEHQSVATPQTARGWARPPCRHFKIRSCERLGSAFEVTVTYQTLLLTLPMWRGVSGAARRKLVARCGTLRARGRGRWGALGGGSHVSRRVGSEWEEMRFVV